MESEKYFQETLLAYKKGVEIEMRRFFQEEICKSDGGFKEKTLKILAEFSFRPAKMIRPILIIVGYSLAGGKDEKAITRASISMELIHNMGLIHDDIIDEDQLRRGGKTMHHVYGGGHDGESIAMMAGDLFGFLGEEILASSDFPPENKLAAIIKLNQILTETSYGQILEIQIRQSAKQPEVTNILEIYRLKTSLYSFVGPLQIGALLAGGKDALLCKIEKSATPLGMAFQIQDDINDKDTWWQPSRELVSYYIDRSKKIILRQDFPEKEKQFLLGLADYILKGEY